jgi:hypothetical protein
VCIFTHEVQARTERFVLGCTRWQERLK